MKIKDQNGKEFKTYDVVRDDYAELEGKIIKYVFRDGSYDTGIIIGCNRSIGVTVVNVEDKNDYLICSSGPVSPGGGNWRESFLCTYNEHFDYIINGIKKGKIYLSDLETMRTGQPSSSCLRVSPSSCPYGQ